MNLFFLVTQEASEKLTASAGGFLSQMSMPLLMIGVVVAIYFFMMRPQQKKEKKLKNMRETLSRGDRLTTIGGIFGRVVEVKDDVITLEVGPERTKMMIARWAVGSVEGGEKEGETLDGK